jgi:hypothetical protein
MREGEAMKEYTGKTIRPIMFAMPSQVGWRRLLATGTLALAILAASAMSAAASEYIEEARSKVGAYGPIGEYSYYNESALFKYTEGGSYGYTVAWTQKRANTPAGYIGARARVYKEGGALCLEPGWLYNKANTSDAESFSPTGIAETCGGGNYYAKGETRAWTGYEYDTYTTFNTPYIHF